MFPPAWVRPFFEVCLEFKVGDKVKIKQMDFSLPIRLIGLVGTIIKVPTHLPGLAEWVVEFEVNNRFHFYYNELTLFELFQDKDYEII